MNRFTRCENGVIADAEYYNRLQHADSASVLLLSDTHGAIDAVRWILSSFSRECQACLFSGDGAQDVLAVVQEASEGLLTIPPVLVMAQGNCDGQLYPPVFPGNGNAKAFGLPLYQQPQIANRRILLAHGHLYHVELDGRKLSMVAENFGCTIAVHGHTHVQSFECFGSVTAINPGSPLRPRGKSYGGFAMLSLATAASEGSAAQEHQPELPYGKVRFYRLIPERNGSFSAAVHTEYPLTMGSSVL